MPQYALQSSGSAIQGAALNKHAPLTESASAIRDAIGTGEQTLAEIHSALSHLESRLDTVLTPIAPMPGDTRVSNAPMVAPQSHVLERIRAFNGALIDAVARIQALRERIEV